MYVFPLRSPAVSELSQGVLELDSALATGESKQGTHQATDAQSILNVCSTFSLSSSAHYPPLTILQITWVFHSVDLLPSSDVICTTIQCISPFGDRGTFRFWRTSFEKAGQRRNASA